jgi:hypothetical protein
VNTAYDASGASTISSTLRAIGQYGYFYVDDRYWNSLTSYDQNLFTTNLNALSAQFDTVIYPRETAFFGSENTPGIDGDPHVVVLMEQLLTGSGGYFETINNYPKSQAPDSNGREMIFVSANSAQIPTGKTYVAHEFQHLISFNQKEILRNVQDDVWLNEGRSEYAITVAGYSDPFDGSTLQRRSQSFVRTPSDSLVEWPNTSTDYAIASVFLHYLADRYGPNIVAATAKTSAIGVPSIDEWLAAQGKTERFGDVFADWMVASYLNNTSIDPRYGYTRAGLNQMHISPTVGSSVSSYTQRSDFTSSLKEWQPLWVQNDISTNSATNIMVRVTGSSDATWRGAVIARYGDGSGRVIPFASVFGGADVPVPAQQNNIPLVTVVTAVAQGTSTPVDDRTIVGKTVTITVALGDILGAPTPVAPSPTPVPTPQSGTPINGDLIRRAGESETYVVWGPYRRYLPAGVLKLYGFENRPVAQVSDSVFMQYQTSNYVREQGGTKVYALWPDGTKHWMNITAAQWDATGRDWGAIFTINSAEVAWYATGADITH